MSGDGICDPAEETAIETLCDQIEGRQEAEALSALLPFAKELWEIAVDLEAQRNAALDAVDAARAEEREEIARMAEVERDEAQKIAESADADRRYWEGVADAHRCFVDDIRARGEGGGS